MNKEYIHKIANLLMSKDQANKDLAFTLMDAQKISFDEVMEIVREVLGCRANSLKSIKQTVLVLNNYKLKLLFNEEKKRPVAYIYGLRKVKSNKNASYWSVIYDSTYNTCPMLDYINYFIEKVKKANHANYSLDKR